VLYERCTGNSSENQHATGPEQPVTTWVSTSLALPPNRTTRPHRDEHAGAHRTHRRNSNQPGTRMSRTPASSCPHPLPSDGGALPALSATLENGPNHGTTRTWAPACCRNEARNAPERRATPHGDPKVLTSNVTGSPNHGATRTWAPACCRNEARNAPERRATTHGDPNVLTSNVENGPNQRTTRTWVPARCRSESAQRAWSEGQRRTAAQMS